MLAPPIPVEEPVRLAALRSTELLDSAADARFDRITAIVASYFRVPIALVSLVDTDRQWFLSCVGLPVRQTGRDISFCGHAILDTGILEVCDAQSDPRFSDNPLVTGAPFIRYYAGRPLHVGGQRVGTLCIISPEPRRPLDERDRLVLDGFAWWVEDVLPSAIVAKQSAAHAESRAAEERARAELFSGVLSAMPLGVIVFRLDDEADSGSLRLVAANPAASTIARFDFPARVGMTISEAIPEDRLAPRFAEVARGGTMFQLEVAAPDDTGRTMALRVFPLPDRCVGIAFEDVTDRRGTEDALRASEDRYRDLFENASDLVQSVLPDGRLEYVNGAWLSTLGYSSDELPELDVWKVLHPDDHAHCMELFGRLMSGQPLATIQTRFVARDGRTVHVEGKVSARTIEGRVVSTRGIFRDVTDRRVAEQAKDEFVSIVSHELRTPLTSIVGALGLVSSGVSGPIADRTKKFVDIALKNAERLGRLINDVLDGEQLRAGKLQMTLTRVELAAAVDAAIEANRSYAELHRVRFVAETHGDTAVDGDEDRLSQVLANLLSNAAKFSPPGGEVAILTQSGGGVVRVSITDRGAGIPASFQHRVFERFAQADGSNTRSHGGSGLGLSITRGLVEAMGGRIGFYTAEGRGTTFWFELPASAATFAKSAPVLVYATDARVAAALRTTIELDGFTALIASDRASAEQLISSQRVSCAIVDLGSTGSDALVWLRGARTAGEQAGVRVIVVSADTALDGISGAALELADWIESPSDNERLLRAVRTAARDAARTARILHVEDDADLVQVVRALMDGQADVHGVPDLATARHMLASAAYDLVVLDCMLPDGSGLDLVPEIARCPSAPPVLVFSAFEVAAEAARAVSAALVKSRVSNAELTSTIRRLVKR